MGHLQDWPSLHDPSGRASQIPGEAQTGKILVRSYNLQLSQVVETYQTHGVQLQQYMWCKRQCTVVSVLLRKHHSRAHGVSGHLDRNTSKCNYFILTVRQWSDSQDKVHKNTNAYMQLIAWPVNSRWGRV